MFARTRYFRLVVCCALLGGWTSPRVSLAEDARLPSVGDMARDFSLETLAGKQVQLSALLPQGPVVLVVLRGFPGYQCPVCNVQVRELLKSAEKFKAARAQVVLVYPGPAEKLQQRAGEFFRGQTLPEHFQIALDPDYRFTLAYNLRWDAKNETAYPSSFVIGTGGAITYAKISKTHGGRAAAADLLQALGGN
jgi:thioredoxin-dependent peroxiredoxin